MVKGKGLVFAMVRDGRSSFIIVIVRDDRREFNYV